LKIDSNAKTLTITKQDGTTVTFREGDIFSLNGNTGEVLGSAMEVSAPQIEGDFGEFMKFVDEIKEIDVLANADTPADAAEARKNGAVGIGLVRTEVSESRSVFACLEEDEIRAPKTNIIFPLNNITFFYHSLTPPTAPLKMRLALLRSAQHMFFDPERIGQVRQLILSKTKKSTDEALANLLPFQRSDFEAIFRNMDGYPVTIRLLDPPLHEFLPHAEDVEILQRLSEQLAIPVAELQDDIKAANEVNPMLGLRGCRLGITRPEIIEMQVRGIFEVSVRQPPLFSFFLNCPRKTSTNHQTEIIFPTQHVMHLASLGAGRT